MGIPCDFDHNSSRCLLWVSISWRNEALLFQTLLVVRSSVQNVFLHAFYLSRSFLRSTALPNRWVPGPEYLERDEMSRGSGWSMRHALLVTFSVLSFSASVT